MNTTISALDITVHHRQMLEISAMLSEPSVGCHRLATETIINLVSWRPSPSWSLELLTIDTVSAVTLAYC